MNAASLNEPSPTKPHAVTATTAAASAAASASKVISSAPRTGWQPTVGVPALALPIPAHAKLNAAEVALSADAVHSSTSSPSSSRRSTPPSPPSVLSTVGGGSSPRVGQPGLMASASSPGLAYGTARLRSGSYPLAAVAALPALPPVSVTRPLSARKSALPPMGAPVSPRHAPAAVALLGASLSHASVPGGAAPFSPLAAATAKLHAQSTAPSSAPESSSPLALVQQPSSGRRSSNGWQVAATSPVLARPLSSRKLSTSSSSDIPPPAPSSAPPSLSALQPAAAVGGWTAFASPPSPAPCEDAIPSIESTSSGVAISGIVRDSIVAGPSPLPASNWQMASMFMVGAPDIEGGGECTGGVGGVEEAKGVGLALPRRMNAAQSQAALARARAAAVGPTVVRRAPLHKPLLRKSLSPHPSASS
jgi:hypothetical protein